MTDYKVLAEGKRSDLVTAVTTHLKAGWKLQGGCCVYVHGYSTYYTQAMAR